MTGANRARAHKERIAPTPCDRGGCLALPTHRVMVDGREAGRYCEDHADERVEHLNDYILAVEIETTRDT